MKLGLKQMEGSIWDEKGHSEIVSVAISHQHDSINSIKFTYSGDYEDVYSSKTYGELDGLKFNTVSYTS